MSEWLRLVLFFILLTLVIYVPLKIGHKLATPLPKKSPQKPGGQKIAQAVLLALGSIVTIFILIIIAIGVFWHSDSDPGSNSSLYIAWAIVFVGTPLVIIGAWQLYKNL